MRFLLFEELVERHVRDSLARALEALGHDVFVPDAYWRGGKFPQDIGHTALCRAALQSALAWEPDVLINFRPSAILPSWLDDIASRRIFSMVWFSDDPVFFGSVYGDVLDKYDLVLHCGSRKVLAFYQERRGFSGLNFPFWTDSVACPPHVDQQKTFDVIFLGNCVGAVRGSRYDAIRQLNADAKILGKVDGDPASLALGYEKDHDLAMQKVGSARIGFNIPQFFSSYAGSEMDFPGLAELGSFELPSRVVQYAATGLPIVSLTGEAVPGYFPEIQAGATIAQCNDHIQRILADAEHREDLSRRTLARFQRSYSALSRARMLDYLVRNQVTGKELPLQRRLTLFEEFGPDPTPHYSRFN